MDDLINNEIEDANEKPLPPQSPSPTLTIKNRKTLFLMMDGMISVLGAIGLLVIGILNSVYPATIYDPPQGEVRAIMETGLGAFLKFHHITWLSVLCCGLVVCGIVIILLKNRKTKS